IAHYELGHFDLLEYLTKSVYRFMAKMESLSAVEEEMFHFLRRSFQVNAHALKPEFEKLLEKLKRYENNPLETRAFSYLDVISLHKSTAPVSIPCCGDVLVRIGEEEQSEQLVCRNNPMYFTSA